MRSAWVVGLWSLIVLVRLHQGSPAAFHPFEFAQVHMGLEVRMRIFASGAGAAENAATAAFARIAVLDRMMSDYRPDSELRRLRGNGKAWTPVSEELFDVIQRAVAIASTTDGAFDPTIGPLVVLWREARANRRLPDRSAIEAAQAHVGWKYIELDGSRRAVRLKHPGSTRKIQLDLGGIAKGYILREALQVLRAHGIPSALIESGGDIVVSDAPPGRSGWRIDVPGASAAFTEKAHRLSNAALASSGPGAQFLEIDGVRYSHVIDPRTGLGLTNNLTARVIATDASTADALATALTVAGPDRWSSVLARFPNTIASVDRLP
jgi:thiamine biosynthesis lipoprotein